MIEGITRYTKDRNVLSIMYRTLASPMTKDHSHDDVFIKKQVKCQNYYNIRFDFSGQWSKRDPLIGSHPFGQVTHPVVNRCRNQGSETKFAHQILKFVFATKVTLLYPMCNSDYISLRA